MSSGVTDTRSSSTGFTPYRSGVVFVQGISLFSVMGQEICEYVLQSNTLKSKTPLMLNFAGVNAESF